MKHGKSSSTKPRAEVGPHPHRVMLLTTRFRFPGRKLMAGRARLYGDRIELLYFDTRGWHRRVVPFLSIAAMEYHALEDGANLSLFLEDEEIVHLNVEQAHRWREIFENWLRYDVLPSAKLISRVDEVSALAG